MTAGRIVVRTLLVLLSLISCVGLLPAGMWLADPLTHHSLEATGPWPFPVLVVSGDTAKIVMLDDLRSIPAPPEGSSYLVPRGRARAIERLLRENEASDADGGWVLRVKTLSPARQRIELFWMADGYQGGVYEASTQSIRPLYRKLTGPGFSLIFGSAALALNGAIWGAGIFAVRWYRRCRRDNVAQQAVGPVRRAQG